MKFLSSLVSVAFGIAAAAGITVAAQAQSAQNTVYSPFQHGTADAKSVAAVALYWEAGKIVRSKNVSGVNNPSKGIYCVHASEHLDPNEIVPIATPEYSGSTTDIMFVYVVDSGADCAGRANTIDIRTYTLSAGGSPALSNGVSFYMSIV